MMTTLLITGSRNATPGLLREARLAVERAKRQGLSIIVGDASGIDAAVIEACDELGVDVTVYGAYGRMRRLTRTGNNNPLNVYSYLKRDEVMALECDYCLALCHSKSRGTMYTYNYALCHGKTCKLVEE